MTSQEFVIWFRGFVAGSNSYNLTPKGWEEVKDKLNSVNDAKQVSFNIGTASTSITATGTAEATVNYTTSNKNLLHD